MTKGIKCHEHITQIENVNYDHITLGFSLYLGAQLS